MTDADPGQERAPDDDGLDAYRERIDAIIEEDREILDVLDD